ncbi:RsfA family transcriptional regulator [Sporolactobacillus sp. THM7-7]|nr:RsfA family transcriptional regulator [Sporolactobacillus sp. THM7-7]
MTKVRQDAWSHEDDLLLAETVLRHIREGSTQLEAFEEVGDRLNRTGAACGFRWNAIVRKKYEQAIEIAKKQRKQKKRAERQKKTGRPIAHPPLTETVHVTDPAALEGTGEQVSSDDTVTIMRKTDHQIEMADVIDYLQSLQINGAAGNRLEQENQHLKEENGLLKRQVEDMKREIEALQSRQQTVEDDYQALIGIMDRARRMVAFQDQDNQGATFKMDQNGNLEKVAK